MMPLINPYVFSRANAAEPAVRSSALQPASVTATPESGASNDEQPATYDELLPYLMLAMASGI